MTAQSSEDQSPSPNAEGVSAGKSARDEIQQPPTQGEIEGLVAEITERGKVSLWADADLYRRAADRLLALQAQVQRGEEERDEARAMLDLYDAPTLDDGDGGPLNLAGRVETMVYAKALAADAELRRVIGEREDAFLHIGSWKACAQAAEARLASLREEVEAMSGQIISGCPGPLYSVGFSDGVQHVKIALLSRLTQETRQPEGEGSSQTSPSSPSSGYPQAQHTDEARQFFAVQVGDDVVVFEERRPGPSSLRSDGEG